MQNILGISLSTRLLGTAVLYDGELTDFRVRTFYGSWNGQKRSDMIRAIRNIVDRYQVTEIVVKIPKATHCSQRIRDLLADIRQIDAEVAVCTIGCLKRLYNGNGRGNKQAMVQSIIAKYPNYRQLAHLSAKERKNGTAYYIKLFEAIACAEMALRTGQ